jgi:hypothetical protein
MSVATMLHMDPSVPRMARPFHMDGAMMCLREAHGTPQFMSFISAWYKGEVAGVEMVGV